MYGDEYVSYQHEIYYEVGALFNLCNSECECAEFLRESRKRLKRIVYVWNLLCDDEDNEISLQCGGHI